MKGARRRRAGPRPARAHDGRRRRHGGPHRRRHQGDPRGPHHRAGHQQRRPARRHRPGRPPRRRPARRERRPRPARARLRPLPDGGPVMTGSPAAPDRPGTAADAPALLPVASPARTRAAVVALLRPQRRLALAALAVMVAATAVGLLVQPLLGRIVDLAADRGSANAITVTAALLAAVAVVQGVATGLGLSLISRLGETTLARLRERFVERALDLPLERVEKAGAGDLTARVTADVSLTSSSTPPRSCPCCRSSRTARYARSTSPPTTLPLRARRRSAAPAPSVSPPAWNRTCRRASHPPNGSGTPVSCCPASNNWRAPAGRCAVPSCSARARAPPKPSTTSTAASPRPRSAPSSPSTATPPRTTARSPTGSSTRRPSTSTTGRRPR